MTYEEIVQYATEQTAGKSTAIFGTERAAYQFNVRGEGEGAFYLEVKDGVCTVAPYEYYDRDVVLELQSDVLIKALGGTSAFKVAALDGYIKVDGDMKYVELLDEYLKSKNVKSKAKTVKTKVEKTVEAVKPKVEKAVSTAKTEVKPKVEKAVKETVKKVKADVDTAKQTVKSKATNRKTK